MRGANDLSGVEDSFALYGGGTIADVEAALQDDKPIIPDDMQYLFGLPPQAFLKPGMTTPCSESGTPDAWFADDPREQAVAGALCERCPVRDACLRWAVETDQHGIWGGRLLVGGARCRHGHAGEWGERADGRRYCKECQRVRARAQRKAS